MKRSLRFRFIILLILLGPISVAILVPFFHYNINRLVARQVKEETRLLASSIDWAIAPLLRDGNIPDVQRLTENIGSDRQIEEVTVFHYDGFPVASNRFDQLNREGSGLPPEVKRIFSEQLLFLSGEENGYFIHAVPVRGTDYLRQEGSDINHVLYLKADTRYRQDSFSILVGGFLGQNILVIAIVTLLVFFFLSIWVLRPLGRFTDAAKHMEEGDYHQKVVVDSRDEFSTFAEIFNSMAAEIEEKSRHLTNYSEHLEHIVQERTADLEKAHDTILQQEKLASIGQLAAGIAHEINNPVGYVMSNVEILLGYVDSMKRVISSWEELGGHVEQADCPAAEEQLGKVRSLAHRVDISYILKDIDSLLDALVNGTRRIRDIVMDLRNFARQEEEGTGAVDVNEALEKALKISWNELKYKCTVEKELQAKLPPVEGNETRLVQVFINLLVNAAQAIEGEGLVTIRTALREQEILIRIADTGKGMTEEVKRRIFDPFFTTKDVGEGTGMGLSISHGIVKNMGGRIDVESRPGGGTSFIITLPVAPPR